VLVIWCAEELVPTLFDLCALLVCGLCTFVGALCVCMYVCVLCVCMYVCVLCACLCAYVQTC